MKKPILTLVLNRNLPDATEAILDSLARHDSEVSDFAVIESGSLPERHARAPRSFVADWPEAVCHGLRYARGFNFGLRQARSQQPYEYYFLVCNDVHFPARPILAPMLEVMNIHDRIGILSPSDPSWGESELVPQGETRLTWHLNHMAWLVREAFIDQVVPLNGGNYLQYLYDGNNFHGHLCDLELIAKAYANDYAAALTTRATFSEERDLNTRKAGEVLTEDAETNRARMQEESTAWLRVKYGFNSRWCLTLYAKAFYREFLERHPDYQNIAL